jgi:peptidoglycan/LPS O-acetylase OafA/YrhL
MMIEATLSTTALAGPPEIAEAPRTANSSQRLHLDFIDGMRGIAALYVVLHHIWQFAVYAPASSLPPRWFSVFSVLKYGEYGVTVFIVLSGFCLMLPVLRGPDRGVTGTRAWLGEFARRRSCRVLPAYGVALAGSMLLIAAVPALRSASGTPWDLSVPSFSTAEIGSHLLLIHNWFEDLRFAFNGPLWSVALELQIYFVFALLLLPIWRRWNLAAAVSIACVLAAGTLLLGADHASPEMLAMFALGMTGAAVGTSNDFVAWREKLPWRATTTLLLLSVIAVTAVAPMVLSVDHASTAGVIVVGLATMAAMISMSIARLGDEPVTGLPRLLAAPLPRRLGGFSFSLYLVHYPLVALVSLVFLDHFQLDVATTFGLLVAIGVPLSLTCAYALHRTVERRFINTPVPRAQLAAPARSLAVG